MILRVLLRMILKALALVLSRLLRELVQQLVEMASELEQYLLDVFADQNVPITDFSIPGLLAGSQPAPAPPPQMFQQPPPASHPTRPVDLLSLGLLILQWRRGPPIKGWGWGSWPKAERMTPLSCEVVNAALFERSLV